MVYGVIYLIVCKLNGMKYVRQTTRPINLRISEHKHGNQYIDRAIQKHGLENFIIKIIEECTTREQLIEREIFWIKELKSKAPNGYNLTYGGDGGLPGFSHTAEAKAKIGAAHKGKSVSEETGAKISAANTGKKRSAEVIAKMSAEHTGAKNNFFGKHHTEKSCAKISAARRDEVLYKNLLAEMDKRNFSYTSLAKLMGLSHQRVSEKMRGKKNFTAKDIAKLVEIFGLPAEYLMARDNTSTTAD